MRTLHAAFRYCAVAILTLGVSAGLTETRSAQATPAAAGGPQYDTKHVRFAPENVCDFVKAFLGTFGGTKQVVVTVTPIPSSTSSPADINM